MAGLSSPEFGWVPLQCRATLVSQYDDTGRPSLPHLDTHDFSLCPPFFHSDLHHLSQCLLYGSLQTVSFLPSHGCFPSSSAGCVVHLSYFSSCHYWGKRRHHPASSQSSLHRPLTLCRSFSQLRNGGRRSPESHRRCCFLTG